MLTLKWALLGSTAMYYLRSAKAIHYTDMGV